MPEFDINIRTRGDVQGAKQADEALQKLNRTVEQSIDPAKRAREESNKLAKAKGELKQAVQGLALEFPVLARVISISTNPIAAALVAVTAGFTGMVSTWSQLRKIGKDESVFGPIIGELNSVAKLTAEINKLTESYAESLKKVPTDPRIRLAKGRLDELAPEPERVNQAEQRVLKARERVAAAEQEVERIETKYNVKDLRNSKMVVGNEAIATMLGGGFQSAQKAVSEAEQADIEFGLAMRNLSMEKSRFRRRGLQAGIIKTDIDAASRGEGPLAPPTGNPVYNGPVSVGPEQTVVRPPKVFLPVDQFDMVARSVDQMGNSFRSGLQLLDARMRAQERLQQSQNRSLELRAANQRLP